MISLFYVLSAILGLSFLIFIHELGHYWMARRVGMRVETFAIGFGKPLYVWERDGVKWQIGWLLFGGYVKIAGTETEEGVDPYEISDGFFGKGPWDRIKVAFMGPFVNLVFALLVFAMLWGMGGREKNFAEFTHLIGWLDPNSELYIEGVRPGDEITAYDEHRFQTAKDHIYSPLVGGGGVSIDGFKVNYETGDRTAFETQVKTYSHPDYLDKGIVTAGVLSPANFVLYDRLPNGEENPMPEGSPLQQAGLEYGDRILWVDGETVFSSMHLSDVLNDGRILLTIQREDKVILRRVPRVQAQELRPDNEFREELIDWQYEAGLADRKFQDLYVIPYNLTFNCIVENPLRFIDQADEKKAFPEVDFSPADEPLKSGDKILAAQGTPILRSFELLKEIQKKKVNIIVQSEASEMSGKLFWNEADDVFFKGVNFQDVRKIASGIGLGLGPRKVGTLRLLPPITPKIRADFPMSEEAKSWLAAEKSERKKMIEEISDPETRQRLLKALETSESTLVLGLPNPQDLKVSYNPVPTQQFYHVANEIMRTLDALFTGNLSPKYITGPVGIVDVVQKTSRVSLKEAFFWLGAISLNLGFLNLLPIPILDGGTILLSFFELITGRRMKPKTLEKVIVVFAVLLISFFVFLTYNDIVRVFGRFLG